LLVGTDAELKGKRGEAARHLLWLMGQDEAFRFLSVG